MEQEFDCNIAPNGVNIREAYKEILDKSPRDLSSLKKEFEIKWEDNYWISRWNTKISLLDENTIGKSMIHHNWIKSQKEMLSVFNHLKKESIIQRLAQETIIGHVQKIYGLYNVYHKELKIYAPMIVMERLVGENGEDVADEIFRKDREEYVTKFNKMEEEVSMYVHLYSSDIQECNSIWNSREKIVRLFDCESWKFKALKGLVA